MKNWAKDYIASLKNGETVQFRPVGNSMIPLIHSGDLVTVEPYRGDVILKIDDIVLVQVGKYTYLHLIKMVDIPYPSTPTPETADYCIGNNKGKINGWVIGKDIYGIVTMIQPKD